MENASAAPYAQAGLAGRLHLLRSRCTVRPLRFYSESEALAFC